MVQGLWPLEGPGVGREGREGRSLFVFSGVLFPLVSLAEARQATGSRYFGLQVWSFTGKSSSSSWSMSLYYDRDAAWADSEGTARPGFVGGPLVTDFFFWDFLATQRPPPALAAARSRLWRRQQSSPRSGVSIEATPLSIARATSTRFPVRRRLSFPPLRAPAPIRRRR